jgi:hypothetical protein
MVLLIQGGMKSFRSHNHHTRQAADRLHKYAWAVIYGSARRQLPAQPDFHDLKSRCELVKLYKHRLK